MFIRKASFAAGTIFAMAWWGLTPAPAAGRALPQQATQPAPSVADAARKARAEKKGEKATKVYTNDDLQNLTATVSIVGEAPAPQTAAPAAPASAKEGTAAPVKNEAYWRAQFAAARRTLADDSKELDVLQREYNLKQQQYYSNPDVAMREQYSRKDLDDTKTQIDAKQQDVAKDNQAISDLEDQLRQAGGDPGWDREQ
jgi:chromosome segregation ATPase